MLNDDEIQQLLQALILAAGEPLSATRLRTLLTANQIECTEKEIEKLLKPLLAQDETTLYNLQLVASGYRFQIKPKYAPILQQLWEEKPAKYSKATLETLALIAYRQPITRAEIENIRGVSASSHIFKTLLERQWIKVIGHKEIPGRPALYATTAEFLNYFNLPSLSALPSWESLDQIPSEFLDTDEEQKNERNTTSLPASTPSPAPAEYNEHAETTETP